MAVTFIMRLGLVSFAVLVALSRLVRSRDASALAEGRFRAGPYRPGLDPSHFVSRRSLDEGEMEGNDDATEHVKEMLGDVFEHDGHFYEITSGVDRDSDDVGGKEEKDEDDDSPRKPPKKYKSKDPGEKRHNDRDKKSDKKAKAKDDEDRPSSRDRDSDNDVLEKTMSDKVKDKEQKSPISPPKPTKKGANRDAAPRETMSPHELDPQHQPFKGLPIYPGSANWHPGCKRMGFRLKADEVLLEGLEIKGLDLEYDDNDGELSSENETPIATNKPRGKSSSRSKKPGSRPLKPSRAFKDAALRESKAEKSGTKSTHAGKSDKKPESGPRRPAVQVLTIDDGDNDDEGRASGAPKVKVLRLAERYEDDQIDDNKSASHDSRSVASLLDNPKKRGKKHGKSRVLVVDIQPVEGANDGENDDEEQHYIVKLSMQDADDVLQGEKS